MNFEQALEQLIGKLNLWVGSLISMLPNLLLASIIIIMGLYLSKKIRAFADKKLDAISLRSCWQT